MKKIAKHLIVAVLGWQVRRLHKKYSFKAVVVVGSIGKTSTKLAIAQTLSASLKVRYQTGNYNDLASVPLIYFGQDMPSLLNPLAWMKVILNNQRQISSGYDYDVVVLEIGTDGPGQIKQFATYVKADVTVVTAITPEHMVYFKDLDEVAAEELSVADFSKQMLVNGDLVKSEYLNSLSQKPLVYGQQVEFDYSVHDIKYSEDGCEFAINKQSSEFIKLKSSSFSEPQVYSLTAAAAVADLLGLNESSIVSGVSLVKPVSGRMQRLEGIKNSTIIDDTYNSSPDAAMAALKTVFRIKAPQKIVLLGNMNELGVFSEAAHIEVGEMCDPSELDLVVTLGPESNTYLADIAEAKGCKVIRTNSAEEAGHCIAEAIKEGALVLVKGSQNGVFAEEAVKLILANKNDESKLVRQSASWLKQKGVR